LTKKESYSRIILFIICVILFILVLQRMKSIEQGEREYDEMMEEKNFDK